MKKVLVMMSTYNGEKYLKEQLESLLNQEEASLDIIIRDDKSKDKTTKILEEYSKKYKNIKIVFGKNLGACKSFFELIKNAELDYDFYALCDQDDVWKKDKVSSGISQLEKGNKDIPAIYYSGQILVDEDLNEIYNHKIDTRRSQYANFIFNQTAGCTIIFNNCLMKHLKEYIPNGVFGHDVWCYKLCFALGGNIYVESEGKILYRQHGNNVVGINNGIKGKIDRAKKYIYKYSPSSYAKELIKGYYNKIDTEKLRFIECIANSNDSHKCRMQLYKDKKICFKSISLRLLFIAKVFLKRM